MASAKRTAGVSLPAGLGRPVPKVVLTLLNGDVSLLLGPVATVLGRVGSRHGSASGNKRSSVDYGNRLLSRPHSRPSGG